MGIFFDLFSAALDPLDTPGYSKHLERQVRRELGDERDPAAERVNHASAGVARTERPRRPQVIPTRTTLRVWIWRRTIKPCAIALVRLEIWLDEGWIASARKDGILARGSEELHMHEARLALARVRLAILLAS